MLKRVTGDLWDYLPTHAIVVPVNLQGVCGRGVARQMQDKYPVVARNFKDHPQWGWFRVDQSSILTFPVKHGWRDKADLKLIRLSCRWLVEWIKDEKFFRESRTTAMPLVGCGFGELTEAEVMPVLEKELAPVVDRVLIVEPDAAVMKKYAESFKPGARRDRRT